MTRIGDNLCPQCSTPMGACEHTGAAAPDFIEGQKSWRGLLGTMGAHAPQNSMTKEDIDTAEIRRAVDAMMPHVFRKGVIGGTSNRCGAGGGAARRGCYPVKTVTFSAEMATTSADEIDRLRGEVSAMEAELKQHVR